MTQYPPSYPLSVLFQVTYLPTHYTELQLGTEKDELVFKQYFVAARAWPHTTVRF